MPPAFGFFVLSLLLLTASLRSRAADVQLDWDANPEWESVTEYRVFEWVAGQPAPVGTTSKTGIKLRLLEPGWYVFTVTAVSPFGESEHSSPTLTFVLDTKVFAIAPAVSLMWAAGGLNPLHLVPARFVFSSLVATLPTRGL